MGLAALSDQRAFVELVRRYEAQVRTLCACLTGNEAIAAELAQDTFLEVWNARERYRPEGRFKELLYMVARNRCRSHARKKWWRQWLPFDETPEDSLPTHASPDELRAGQERDALVRQALSKLPEKFRLPLTLRYVDELDYAAIARIIERTESAARSRVMYGLQALAALLPPEVADGL
ncbi:MAG: sigma-70 family RNA polymerase sigma factor [Archangium sp.]